MILEPSTVSDGPFTFFTDFFILKECAMSYPMTLTAASVSDLKFIGRLFTKISSVQQSLSFKMYMCPRYSASSFRCSDSSFTYFCLKLFGFAPLPWQLHDCGHILWYWPFFTAVVAYGIVSWTLSTTVYFLTTVATMFLEWHPCSLFVLNKIILFAMSHCIYRALFPY